MSSLELIKMRFKNNRLAIVQPPFQLLMSIYALSPLAEILANN